ncbi:hypothetical protein E2C01_041999 [Portunus trituberculatus]|uniref:Uncharacterized protein n=1 Tax=Portunus trituberculatus TaxID=210409 RepID=A0A5B7FLC6_PORTR|nr:hypothetical protein [Portunus trituberculatus]
MGPSGEAIVVRGRLNNDPSKFRGGGGGGDGISSSGARTPLSLAQEGEAVQSRDKVDMLGVMLMRIMSLLDGKGLEVLYKIQDLLLLLVVARHTARLTLEYNNTLPQFYHTIAPGKSVILLLRLLTRVLSIFLNGTNEKTS